MVDADELVTVRLTVGWQQRQARWVTLCGREVARREVWDQPVVLGEGCEVVSGWWPRSAGSMAEPQLGYSGPVVVEVAGVPRADLDGDWDAVVVDEGGDGREAVIRDALEAERTRLLERVAKIEEILAEDEPEPDVELEEEVRT